MGEGFGWGLEEEIHGAVLPLDCRRGIEGKKLMAIGMHYHALRFVQMSSSFGVGNDLVFEG